MERALEQGWLNHVSSDVIPFPRDVGIPVVEPWRHKAHTRKEYVDMVSHHLNFSDLYVSLFSDWQIRHRAFNKVFLDFDAKALSASFKDAQKTVEYIEKHYGNYPRVYFSGRKGFHVIFDFEPTVFGNYPETIREFVYNIMTELKLKTLDKHSVGDLRRVTRIPYTINQKANRLCIPISLDWDLKEILWESKNCEFRSEIKIQGLHGLSVELKEIDGSIETRNSSSISEVNFAANRKEYIDDLKLLLKVAENGLDDFRTRTIIFMIIPRMVALGKTDQEIRSFSKEFVLRSSPESRKDLHDYLNITTTRSREGTHLPWSWEAFLTHFPEFARYLEGVKG